MTELRAGDDIGCKACGLLQSRKNDYTAEGWAKQIADLPPEPPRLHNHIEDGGRVIASFESREDAELFRWARDITARVEALAAQRKAAALAGIPRPPEPAPMFREVLQLAKQEADYHGHEYLDAQHLLLALVKCSSAATKPFLEAHGIGIKQARDFIVAMHGPVQAHEVGHGLPGAEFGDEPAVVPSKEPS